MFLSNAVGSTTWINLSLVNIKTTWNTAWVDLEMLDMFEEKPRKNRWIFKVKSRKNRGKSGKTGFKIWSISKSNKRTQIGVQKGTRFPLAYHTRSKRSIETTHYSVKVKCGIIIIKLVKIMIGLDVTGRASERHLKLREGDFILLNKRPLYRP